ncbi:GNAT family N-acetyltransferase [Ureaplasma canigenitalium]|uniref:GNAT family N-acetyltransferase n=1 Tax=Ureaplasma canigenitalium TaxID=42092 RepID=UPI0004E1B888|nr:N-acetyltransferase [Ureaplasma canigenitalium]
METTSKTNSSVKEKYLRNATLNDLGLIATFEKETFGIEAYSKETLIEILTSDHSNIIVGIYQDIFLVSYMIVTKTSEFNEVLRINVVPQFQKIGFGSLMIHHLMNEGMDIVLEVSVNNEKANNFYQKLGFIKNGTRKNYYSDGSDAINYRWYSRN